MLALGAYLLASVAAAAPAAPAAHAEQLASTYDEAACDPADSGECAAPEAEPTSSLPAILDCNDERLSLVMQEMIGTCDMPRPAPPLAHLPTLRNANAPGGSRLCDGLCDHESYPLKPAPRTSDDGPPLITTATPTATPPAWSPLPTRERALRRSDFASRLERPPRA